MEENKRLTLKIREFLESGTPKARISTVALCILTLASIPVLLFMASAMGNAVQVFRQFETSKRFKKEQIRSSVNSLRRQRLIEYVKNKEGKTLIKITSKGQERIRDFSIDLIEIKRPKKWDGKWHLVMFDIPVRFKKSREALRYHLRDLGFYQFQKSVWVNPYPCEDEILFIANFFGVEKYVEILTADKILEDEKLRKFFVL